MDVLTELSLPKILDMVMSESELAADCFNPNETDEQYFLRRKEFYESSTNWILRRKSPTSPKLLFWLPAMGKRLDD